jgi:hypothetical protein
MNAGAIYWMNLKRYNPEEYEYRKTLKSLRLWQRNRRDAEDGVGFFKVDYCDAMINMYAARMVQFDTSKFEQ